MAKYITNVELLNLIKEGKAKKAANPDLEWVDCIPAALARAFMLIAERYSKKSSWAGYSYREDMVSEAVLILVRNWHKFDSDNYTNAFAYYTMCIERAFIGYREKQVRQADIQDELMKAVERSPRWNALANEDEERRKRMQADAGRFEN